MLGWEMTFMQCNHPIFLFVFSLICLPKDILWEAKGEEDKWSLWGGGGSVSLIAPEFQLACNEGITDHLTLAQSFLRQHATGDWHGNLQTTENSCCDEFCGSQDSDSQYVSTSFSRCTIVQQFNNSYQGCGKHMHNKWMSFPVLLCHIQPKAESHYLSRT